MCSVIHLICGPLSAATRVIALNFSLILLIIKRVAIRRSEYHSALFMTFTIYNYYGLDMDWYKQMAVIESLKTAKVNLKRNLFLMTNIGLNWLNREIHGKNTSAIWKKFIIFKKIQNLQPLREKPIITVFKKILS